MNNKIVNVFAFIGGAAIGAVATWKLLDAKYKNLAEKEISEAREEIREVYSQKKKEDKNESDNSEKQNNKQQYPEIVKALGYSSGKKENKGESMKNNIYTISPDSVGDTDYDLITLSYYADGVLAYESDDKVEDIDGMVGLENLNKFGEYEDDCVFVRNDELEKEFEILRDLRKYSEVVED